MLIVKPYILVVTLVVMLVVLSGCNTTRTVTTEVQQQSETIATGNSTFRLDEIANTLSTLKLDFEVLEMFLKPEPLADGDSVPQYSIAIKAERATITHSSDASTQLQISEERTDTIITVSDTVLTQVEETETQVIATPINFTLIIIVIVVLVLIALFVKIFIL